MGGGRGGKRRWVSRAIILQCVQLLIMSQETEGLGTLQGVRNDWVED